MNPFDALLSLAAACASIGNIVVAANCIGLLTKASHRNIATLPFHPDSAPTVSLIIAARNEDHALADCLHRAVLSTYPKLEIIVLDDSSHDQTPHLIRSFAHDGVRFIAGDPPREGWLGRNQAIADMFDQSSGDYVIYAGVDTILDPDTITAIIKLQTYTGSDMLSIIPKRRDVRTSSLLQPLRYLPQLVLPLQKDPVSPAIWSLKRPSGHNRIDFDTYKADMQIEQSLIDSLDTHHFTGIAATRGLYVATEKKPRSQFDTALRERAPAYGRGIGRAVWSAVYIASLSAAIGYVVAASMNESLYMQWAYATALLAAASAVLAGYVYASLTTRLPLIGALLFPANVLLEGILWVASYAARRSGTLRWKGRRL